MLDDEGSQVTLLRNDVAEELGLDREPQTLCFRTFHGADPNFEGRIIRFKIKSLDDKAVFDVHEGYTVPKVNITNPRMDWASVKKSFSLSRRYFTCNDSYRRDRWNYRYGCVGSAPAKGLPVSP